MKKTNMTYTHTLKRKLIQCVTKKKNEIEEKSYMNMRISYAYRTEKQKQKKEKEEKKRYE